jgi:hypothetical protein
MDKISEANLEAPSLGKTRHGSRISNSMIVWGGLLLYLVLVKSILTAFFPGAFNDPTQAGLFSWVSLAIIGMLGLVGVFLSERTGFPSAWQSSVPVRNRILLPLLTGLALGAALSAFDLFTHFTSYILARHGLAQQFVGYIPSFLIFSGGSILIEVIFRLLPIPLFVWLISNVLLKGGGQSQTFWVLALLFAALEPLSQSVDILTLPPVLMFIDFAIYYAVNFVQIAYFRKYGFLASILVRVAFYFVWHTLYVH